MKKKKKPKFMTILIIGMFTYFLYIVCIYQQDLIDKKNYQINEIKSKIAEEKDVNKKLKSEKANINSQQYIESIARKKLGMVKKGEKIFVDIDK